MVDIKLKKQNHQMYFRDYSTLNTYSYIHDVYAFDWNAVTGQCSDLHEITACVIDTLKLIVDKHAPMKQASRNIQLKTQEIYN